MTNGLESIQKNCITGSNSLTACQSKYISSISPNDKQDGLDAVDVLKRIQINEDGPFFSKPNYVAQELQKINHSKSRLVQTSFIYFINSKDKTNEKGLFLKKHYLGMIRLKGQLCQESLWVDHRVLKRPASVNRLTLSLPSKLISFRLNVNKRFRVKSPIYKGS